LARLAGHGGDRKSETFKEKSSGKIFPLETREVIGKRAELGMALEPIEKELAERRYKATFPIEGKKGFQPVISSNELNTGQARDLVAKQVGLSPTTYQRAKTIIEKAPEALKEKVRSGETSRACL
jgi:hypothetical protein